MPHRNPSPIPNCEATSTSTVKSHAFSSCLLRNLNHFLTAGELQSAVNLLPVLARRGLRPKLDTFAALLQGCLRSKALTLACDVHLHLSITGLKKSIPSHTLLSNQVIYLLFAIRRSDDARLLFDKMFVRNVYSYNAMISGYAKMGMPEAARKVFEKMEESVRDVVSWNTVIFALARGGMWKNAIQFYVRMRREFLGYNEYTYSGILVACVQSEQLEIISQFHRQAFGLGFLSNVVISSSLLDAYFKCGNLESATKLFYELPTRDVHTWTTLVSGYAKSGNLALARKLFDEMPCRTSVSWSAMIGGYVQCGCSVDALEMFGRMLNEGVKPDQFGISSSLCSCADMASIKHGKQIHAYLIRSHFHPNVIILSALIDMYSKCGDLKSGRLMFDTIPTHERDAVLWNTMISAYGQNGFGTTAVELFEEMVRVGATPNRNTLVVILTACSHSGLVSEGTCIFSRISQDHGIIPDEEHHACFVDLLGRSGLLKEAKDWIQNLPSRSNILVWKALLGACRIHGNVELGREAAERLFELDPHLSASYVQLSNIYNDIGRWDSAAEVRSIMGMRKVRKEQAASYLEVK